MKESALLLNYPFELFKKIILEMGKIFSEHKEFDDLIDIIASISEKRDSEKSAGNIFLERGIQKFTKKSFKDAIIYFGKAILKLAKEEAQNSMIIALLGLGYAYQKLGLIWASNNSFSSAASISLKSFDISREIDERAINIVKQLVENELYIGRIPHFLSWYELFVMLINQKNLHNQYGEDASINLIDACLGVRILNSDFTDICKQSYLPDVFDEYGLFMSSISLLYLLGYEEEFSQDNEKNIFDKDENIDKYFSSWANQPFKNQMIFKTIFGDSDHLILTSTILGCKIDIEIINNTEMILVAETILAFLEGFFATSLNGIYPKTEKLTFNFIEKTSNKVVTFSKVNDFDKYDVFVSLENFRNNDLSNLWQSMMEFIGYLLFNHFFIKHPNEHIQNLFEKEETHERLSLIFNHLTFIKNIFGLNPKFILDDWINKEKVKEYPAKRSECPSLIISNDQDDNVNEPNKSYVSEVRHDKRKVISLINDELWNKAIWKGIGFVY